MARARRGAELAAAAVDGAAAQRAARVFGRLTGGSPPESADSGDFAITIQAMLAHDTTADLSGLGVPTLVIGGGQDPFYPESALRETAGAMPSASLRVVEGSGHGLPKHQAAWLQEELIAFFGD
ncbi:alpha/beta fold hydrolase [Nonomuraea basaltis]|uniref:alpha/beta fold hydrolase n=1 Tax=Nonomuraea basaltis TaxID=2495887 RepID=UPI00110C68CC|nr:alpha/beta hydrolase [Nonomuraea basaltis]TMR91428.1 hypothetical protein EJK15_50090 [Nonomuraea basaltis]